MFSIASALLAFWPCMVPAALLIDEQTTTSSETAYPCSATDLINLGQSSFLSRSDVSYTAFNGSSTTNLNNGVLGTASEITHVAFDLDGVWETTFTLDTSANTNGYTITNITTIAGWPGGRANQLYAVSLAYTGAPFSGFASIGLFDVDMAGGGGSSKITLTDTRGYIASNVIAIRFTISNPGGSHETTYREIDVHGIPSPLPYPDPAILPKITGQTGPGGLGSTNGGSLLDLWLSAGSVAQTNGSAVTNWSDLSGNGREVVAGSGSPTLVSPFTNGQPAVRLDGDDWFRRTNAPISVAEVFAVTRYGLSTFTEYNGLYGIDPSTGLNIYFLNGFQGTARLAQGTLDYAVARKNGTNIAASTGHDFTPVTTTWIGLFQLNTPINSTSIGVGAINPAGSRAWNGELLELASFNTPLNSAERLILENYASAKYNIPLASGSDHYSGDETAQGDYDSDVFGIGRVDSSNLRINSGSAGFGLFATGTTDGNWVLAGHKTPTNALVSNRWTRVWYVDTTGLSGSETLTLTFDWSDAGLGAAQPHYQSLGYSATEGGAMTSVGIGTYSGDRVSIPLLASALNDGYYTLISGITAGSVLIQLQ